MNSQTLLYRLVHPAHVHAGMITSQVFRPQADSCLLTVFDETAITPGRGVALVVGLLASGDPVYRNSGRGRWRVSIPGALRPTGRHLSCGPFGDRFFGLESRAAAQNCGLS